MSSVIGSLVGGLFSKKPKQPRAEAARSVSRSDGGETPKAKTAAKLALIKTGGGKQGVLSGDSTGGRKKLLGN